MNNTYVPYCEWRRNHGAMRNGKLLAVLRDYEFYFSNGWTTDAVWRVMEHGGDIKDNYDHCRNEARNRVLIAS